MIFYNFLFFRFSYDYINGLGPVKSLIRLLQQSFHYF